MGKRINELFIGSDKMSMEGRSIKHPALIKLYATVNANKISKNVLPVVGLDIETNHLTGEPRLFGFYDPDKGYRHYTKDLFNVFISYLRYCKSANINIAYWNRLDPFVIFRLFLKEVTHDEQNRSLKHFGKIDGEWNKKLKKWNVKPVIEIKKHDLYYGIKNVIRSSIQFFYYREGDREINTIWAYDIAPLYPFGLEMEATSRLPYYSKVDKSAHLVEWDRFQTDEHYRENIVLKSNYLDARAVYDLAIIIQNDFKTAFSFYPKTLISQGSFARSAIVAEIYKKLEKDHSNEKSLFQAILKEVQSIGLINYKDEWAKKYGAESYKDMEALFTETYSGGYIEAIRYGYSNEGYYADIASAYPGVIKDLYDLRGSIIKSGKGVPTPEPFSYTFIRGTVTIPEKVQFHTITVKHWLNKDTNIRPAGTFKASYTIEERDFLIKEGATFKDEHYYMIVTKGKLSPLAEICLKFIELRKQLKKAGSSSEHMAKIAVNSIYGILFEAVDTYEQIEKEKIVLLEKFTDNTFKDILNYYKKKINFSYYDNDLKYYFDNRYSNIKRTWHDPAGMDPEDVKNELSLKGVNLEASNGADIVKEIIQLFNLNVTMKREDRQLLSEVIRAGYRAGEFWNPIYASIITSRTRLLLAKGARDIEKAGGKVILLMTDSILWQGSGEMLPAEYVRDKKTLGYFETPEKVTDIVCLGSGRYGYTNKYGTFTAKKRGLNVSDIHDKDGVILNRFNWADALKIMQETGKTEIDVNVRALVSPGMVVHNHKYGVDDLGRVVIEKKTVPAIVGKNKRYYDINITDPAILATDLVDTRPITLYPGMFGIYEIMDQTLPELRAEFMEMTLLNPHDKRKHQKKKHYYKTREIVRGGYRYRYALLKDLGYEPKEASKLANLSNIVLKEKIEADGHEIKELL